MLKPKLLTTLKNYSWHQFRGDLVSGVVVGNSKKQGIAFTLSDVHAQPLIALERSGLLDAIGEDNVFGNIDDALNRAREILNLPPMERHIPFIPTVKREMDHGADPLKTTP